MEQNIIKHSIEDASSYFITIYAQALGHIMRMEPEIINTTVWKQDDIKSFIDFGKDLERVQERAENVLQSVLLLKYYTQEVIAAMHRTKLAEKT